MDVSVVVAGAGRVCDAVACDPEAASQLVVVVVIVVDFVSSGTEVVGGGVPRVSHE